MIEKTSQSNRNEEDPPSVENKQNKEQKVFDDKIIKISDSLMKTYVIGGLCLTFPGFLILFIFLFRFSQEFETPQLIFTVLFIGGFPIITILIFYFIKGLRNSTFIMSVNKLEFFANKFLFLRLYWTEIEKIIVQKETFRRPVSRYTLSFTASDSGYSLNFSGENLDRIINLWCFPFSKKKQNAIIDGLDRFSQRHNKKLILKNKIEDLYDYNKLPCEEINNFMKLHKKRV